MKSTIIVESWRGQGGVQEFNRNFRRVLENMGYSVDTVVYGNSSFETAKEEGFTFFPGLGGLLSILLRAIRSRQDFILVNQPKALTIAPLLKLRTRRMMYAVHIDLDSFLSTKLRMKYFTTLCQLADITVLFSSLDGLKKGKKRLPATMDLAYIPAPLFGDEIATTPYSDDRPYDIVFYGRMAAQKDPHKFLDICARLYEAGTIKRVAMVGSGPMTDDVTRAVKERSLDFIDMIGEVTRSEGFDWLRKGRLFLLTSTHEGLAFTQLEAAMCGTIVVSAPTPVGPRELLQNFGRLLDGDSVDEYCAAVTELLEAPAKDRAALSQKGIDYAQNYTLDGFAAVLKPLLKLRR